MTLVCCVLIKITEKYDIILYIIHTYLSYISMSLITTLSIKEEYKQDYFYLRNYLNRNNQSIGDFLINQYRENKNKTQHLLKK